MQGEFWLLKTKDVPRDREEKLRFLMQAIKLGLNEGDVYVEVKVGDKSYTPAQHSAIWKYCSMVADALRGKGVTLRMLLDSMRKGGEIEVTKENVKYQMWAPVQKALFAEESMRRLEKQHVTQVSDHLHRFLVNEHGISVPFPSKDIPDAKRN